MPAKQQQMHHSPFDAVARSYDRTFSSSQIGRAQRGEVWRVLAKTFQTGDHILEIGCGTGVDACFLAERNIRVFACDSSLQMIAVTDERLREHELQQFVQTRVLSGEQLSSLPAELTFDGAFSNFGALNCIQDLPGFARDLADRVRPGEIALLCWMGPFCLWEAVWYLAHGNRRKAFRRLKRHGVSAKISNRSSVQVYYPAVRSITKAFSPEFRLQAIRGIGVTVPPSYLEDWVRRHPKMFGMFEKADTILGRCPGVRVLADHILITLRREGSTAATKSGAANS